MRYVMRLAVPVLILGLAVGMQAPATAADGDNVPPSANASAWTDAYRPTPAEWVPRGMLITDSGFRAYPDGFGFFNMGDPDELNHSIFGSPLTPDDLDGPTLRSLMGAKVCVERGLTGPCTPTLQAKQWIAAVNAEMGGGHCFGFAVTASMLFTGALNLQQFDATAATTYALPLTTGISREIARNMAAQFAADLFVPTTPRTVVARLKQALTAGNSPYVLTLFWPEGGHAVTPFALYDKGDGQYDIAIYDNNYPDAARAVHVDTKANTFEYLVATSPSQPPIIASGALGLVPIAEVSKMQNCPFCAGSNDTSVTINPVRTRVPITVTLTDLNGNVIPGVTTRRSTNPWKPGQPWSFPTFVVPKGKSFAVRIDASRRTRDISTSVFATTGQFTVGAYDAVIPAGKAGVVGLKPNTGQVIYASASADLGRLIFVDALPSSQVAIVARAANRTTPAIVGALKEDKRRVVLRAPDANVAKADFTAELSFADEGAAVSITASGRVTLPAHARLVIDYKRWSPAHPRAITANVIDGDVITPVRIRIAQP